MQEEDINYAQMKKKLPRGYVKTVVAECGFTASWISKMVNGKARMNDRVAACLVKIIEDRKSLHEKLSA